MSNAIPYKVEEILEAQFVRKSCMRVFEYVQAGEGQFKIDLKQLPAVVERVVAVTQRKYPDLQIPVHSRLGHFNVGGYSRVLGLQKKFESVDKVEAARRFFDLVIPSVLLDAGSGSKWKYKEASTGLEVGRSEGLALASYVMFTSGQFSADTKDLYRADAKKLKNLTAEELKRSLQVSVANPMDGLEGRVKLLQDLGSVVEKSEYFNGRVGGLVDHFIGLKKKKISASLILQTVLQSMGEIWPGRLAKDKQNLGDVWIHQALQKKTKDGVVALHKLSQWLTYSLIEPLTWAGLEVVDLDGLTGLAEYRNGGLFVDANVLVLKKKAESAKAQAPSSDMIIEWRALTVVLLDRLLPLVRAQLKLSEKEFPLVKMLEGGTWWAGREIAKQLRKDGSPPFQIVSDGTVF